MKLFIARQSILDVNQQLYGYEFLYRNSEENHFCADINGTVATRTLISNLTTEFDWRKLTAGRFAFVNFTEEMLKSNFVSYLRPRDLIIEILETVRADTVLFDKLKDLKEKGYQFALDDYSGESNILMDVADIIKVDFRLTTLKTQQKIAQEYGHKILLAEKIETEEEFLQAKIMKYQLFQGYYFSKPIVLSEETVEVALGSYLKLWTEINKPEISFDQLDRIIRLDVNLSYKLMTRINSMEYYRGNQVTSIKPALIQMGHGNLRRWILLLLLRDCFGENGTFSTKLALTRAVFSEQIALLQNRNDLHDDAYIVGLFSSIDAVINRQLEEVLDKLFISKAAKDALLGHPGPLADILRFTHDYEQGLWDLVDAFLFSNQIKPEELSSIYRESINFAEEAFCT